MGDGRETTARVQPQAEGLDFGSAGFDFGAADGFTLSRELDGACCPKIPDTVAAETTVNYSAANAVPVMPVQIQVATLDEVRAAVVANDTREVKQVPQAVEVPAPIAPATPEIKISPAVAEVGAINYGSVSFDFGGPSGEGAAAGLGFSLSESLAGDCCPQPVVATTTAGSERLEIKAVQIQEKSLDEVKATAVANDSREVSQVQQVQPVKEVAPPVAEQRSNVSGAPSQGRADVATSVATLNSRAFKAESISGSAGLKSAAADQKQDVPKASSSEALQVRERPSRDVSSSSSIASGVDKQARLSNAIPVATETTVISAKAKGSAPDAIEVLGGKVQRTSEIRSEDISRGDKVAAARQYSPKEVLAGAALERVSGNSIDPRLNARPEAGFRSRDLARPAEQIDQVRISPITRSYPQADTVLKGEARGQASSGAERVIRLSREQTLSSAKARENIEVNSKELRQVPGISNRSSLQRVLDGIRAISPLLKGERAQEKTMVVRLSNDAGKEGVGERAIERKGIVQSVKEHVLALKERVAEKLAPVVERVVNLPGVRNVVAFAQRMTELVQRIPMPERLQNLLRVLSGKAKDEPAYVMKLGRLSVSDAPLPKEPIVRRISQFIKQHVVTVISEQIQRASNLPGVKQILALTKKAGQFVARFQRHGRIEKEEHKSEAIRAGKNESAPVVSPQGSLRMRLQRYLNWLQKGKNTETARKLEKKPSTLKNVSPKTAKSQMREPGARLSGKQRQDTDPVQARIAALNVSKNRLSRNLSLAASLGRGRIRPDLKQGVAQAPRTARAELLTQRPVKGMREIPLKKLNSESFLYRQTKKGNLLQLNRLRRRGMRGGRQLRKYLDPGSLLYRRLMRELSLDELEKFLKGMAAQKARGVAWDYYFEPRRKKRRQNSAQPV